MIHIHIYLLVSMCMYLYVQDNESQAILIRRISFCLLTFCPNSWKTLTCELFKSEDKTNICADLSAHFVYFWPKLKILELPKVREAETE